MGKQDGEGDSQKDWGRCEHTHSLNTGACGSTPGKRATGPFLLADLPHTHTGSLYAENTRVHT